VLDTLSPVAHDLPDGLCQRLLPAMAAAGFTGPIIESLAANGPLLRRTLARTAASMPVHAELDSAADPRQPHGAAFTCALSALNLDPSDWIDYIQERNGQASGRYCEITAGADYGRHKVFAKRAPAPLQRLLLIETANGTRPESDIVLSAQTLMPDCTARTVSRSIFEVLRQMWGVVNEINAAYVVVADPTREPGAPLPILFNPPSGSLKLGFVNHIPKNFGYNGYLAYCS
jgi:hypothetical protein